MSVQFPEKRHFHSSIHCEKCLQALFPGSWPIAPLGNSTGLRVEDGLGGAWQQYLSMEKTVLLLSVQAGAVLSSAPESGGYSLLDHPGLRQAPGQSHTLGRAAWGSCTLPPPT